MHYIFLRIGRRGTFICLMALLWFGFGLYVLISNEPINLGDAILYEQLPVGFRASLWFLTSLMAFICAFRSSGEKVGFALLAFMPAERLFSFLWSVANYLIPGYPPGVLHAFAGTVIWSTILLLLYVVAGWDDDVHKEER